MTSRQNKCHTEQLKRRETPPPGASKDQVTVKRMNIRLRRPQTQLPGTANVPQWLLELLNRQQFVNKFCRTTLEDKIFTLLPALSIRSGQRTIRACQTLDELNEVIFSEPCVPGRAGNHAMSLLKMSHRNNGPLKRFTAIFNALPLYEST